MSDVQYSLADVAKIIGKSEKTISRWIKSGKLPAVKFGTGYLISEKDIPLRLDSSIDRHDFIQKQLLSHTTPEVTPAPKMVARGVDMNGLIDVTGLIAGGQVDMRLQTMENLSMMLQKHQNEVEKIIREQNELAEKYARATYKIGQIEERNRQLEEQNVKLEQKMSLLPLPEQWNSTQKEMADLKESLKTTESSYQQRMTSTETTLKDLEKERDQLKQDLEQERSKGFWSRVKGLFS